jgi:hypothetical protein
MRSRRNYAVVWISSLFFPLFFFLDTLFSVTTNDEMEGYDYVAMFGRLLYGMMKAWYYLYLGRALGLGLRNAVLCVSGYTSGIHQRGIP